MLLTLSVQIDRTSSISTAYFGKLHLMSQLLSEYNGILLILLQLTLTFPRGAPGNRGSDRLARIGTHSSSYSGSGHKRPLDRHPRNRSARPPQLSRHNTAAVAPAVARREPRIHILGSRSYKVCHHSKRYLDQSRDHCLWRGNIYNQKEPEHSYHSNTGIQTAGCGMHCHSRRPLVNF